VGDRHRTASRGPEQGGAGAASRAAIWHDLECGGYRADLALWLELAASSGARSRILDVGAGTGRVTLALARAGHRVTALDLDPDLLDELADRAGGADVETVCADARSFSLGGDDFDACFIPMQTIQLLGDRGARLAFLRCARAHVRPGGKIACAIVTAVEPFDCSSGQLGPAPETAVRAGALYVSRPTRVAVDSKRVVIERERRIFPIAPDGSGPSATAERTPHEAFEERNVTELAVVSAAELRSEGIEAELLPLETLSISPTAEHVGSEVVVFGV
jgi:SAM-dependent methyltransferase